MFSVIYYTLILFLFCIKGFCQDIKLLTAESLPWSGGPAGSPPGINYTVKVLKRTSSEIRAEKLWIGDRFLVPDITVSADTLTFTATRYLRSRRIIEDRLVLGEEDTPVARPPVKYKGDALLQYKAGNKTRYLVIKRFKRLSPQHYP